MITIPLPLFYLLLALVVTLVIVIIGIWVALSRQLRRSQVRQSDTVQSWRVEHKEILQEMNS